MAFLFVCFQRLVSLGSLQTLYFGQVGGDFTQTILLCLLWFQAR